MNNEKFIKSSTVIDRILKIVQGFTVAGIIVSAIFIPLTAVFGEKVIADASILELGRLRIELAGEYNAYLNLPAIKISIIVTLAAAIIALIVVWLCLKKLREILVPMKGGRPFDAGISEKIRQLALTVLIGGGVAEICRAVGAVFEIKAYDLNALFNNPSFEHITFNYGISLWFVVVALVLFFLSYVFRYGEELQRESDETL
jgi:hypothetical protein